MAGGNGHLGGIDAGTVLRIKTTGLFPPADNRSGKAHNKYTRQKKGNGRSENAKRKPHNTLHERSPLEQPVEYEGLSAKLIH